MIATVDAQRGDALDTYLEALAAANGVTLRSLMERTGVLDDTGRFPALWGAVIADRHADRLRDTVGIDAHQMTLSRYHPTALDLHGLDPDRPTSMRTVLRRQWLHIAGSRYCPECLRAGRHWQTAWKLPWTFACTTHRVWLHDICPDCERRPRTYGDKPTTQPAFSTVVAHPSRCPNRARTGHSNIGRAAAPCGTDLSRVPSTRCPTVTVKAQRSINNWLNALTVEFLGRTVAARDAFHTLQAVCIWLDAGNDRTGSRPWLTPPTSAIDIGNRTRHALSALTDDLETAADRLAEPLAPAIRGRPSARMALRDRTARNPVSDELADAIAARFERTSTRHRRRATQLLLPLSGVTIEGLIDTIDDNIDYDAFRILTGVVNKSAILRDAVIIDAVLAAGARTAAHAVDLANLEPGAVKRHTYIRNLVNRNDKRKPWLALLDRLTIDTEPTEDRSAFEIGLQQCV